MERRNSFSSCLLVRGLSNPPNLCDADSARLVVYFLPFSTLRKGGAKKSISAIYCVGLFSVRTCMAFASGDQYIKASIFCV